MKRENNTGKGKERPPEIGLGFLLVVIRTCCDPVGRRKLRNGVPVFALGFVLRGGPFQDPDHERAFRLIKGRAFIVTIESDHLEPGRVGKYLKLISVKQMK